MPEPAGHHLIQRALARMTKGGVPQVVRQRDGFGQILVQPQRAGDGAGDLGYLQRMGQPGAVMVALRRQKHLCFVL